MSDELLPRIWARRLALLAALAAVLVLVHLLHGVLLPFLLAWIAAYLASPLVDALERRWKGRREGAVLFVMALFFLSVLVLLAVSIPIVIQESSALAARFPAYRALVLAEIEYWQAEGRIPVEARNLAFDALERLQGAAPEIAAAVGRWLIDWLSSLLGIFNVLLDLLLFAFVFYYFLRDFHVVNRRLLSAAPARHRDRIRDLLSEIDLNLKTVLRGQLMVAVAMGACYTLGLSLAGVPYAVLIGPVSGLGNFLPYVGPLLGMVPAFLFTALHHSGDAAGLAVQAAWILGVFGLVQVLESYWLTPKLAGESVGLGPVAVLFALSVGGALLGIVGVVVALPLAAIVKVLLERGWDAYRASAYYGGGAEDPDEPTPAGPAA